MPKNQCYEQKPSTTTSSKMRHLQPHLEKPVSGSQGSLTKLPRGNRATQWEGAVSIKTEVLEYKIRTVSAIAIESSLTRDARQQVQST